MRVELLIIDGCPHADSARRLLRHALDGAGLGRLAIETSVVASDQDARRRGFGGSPSFHVNGRDLFVDAAAAPAHACRLYRTAAGLSPLPELGQLRQALQRAADGVVAS